MNEHATPLAPPSLGASDVSVSFTVGGASPVIVIGSEGTGEGGWGTNRGRLQGRWRYVIFLMEVKRQEVRSGGTTTTG